MRLNKKTSSAQCAFELCDASASSNDFVRLFADDTSNDVRFVVNSGGVKQVDITSGNLVVDQEHTLVVAVEEDNTALYLDGALAGSVDTSCSMPANLDKIMHGNSLATSRPLNGTVKNLWIRNGRMTTEQIAQL